MTEIKGYPIEIIPVSDYYKVYYNNILYCEGSWEGIARLVDRLKIYHDVKTYLESQIESPQDN